MKTLATFCLAALCSVPLFAGPRDYQAGKILGFDTGQGSKNSKHPPKADVVYQVQIGPTIYKVTNYSKKQDFSAGEEVQCRVDKTHLIIEKLKGGEVKYDILGESSQPEHPPSTNP